MSSDKSPFEKINHWIKNSVSVKLMVIGILMLLMMIPASMIKSIIYERESLNNRAVNEVSSKWAKSQRLNGPILTIPLLYEWEKDGKTHTSTKNWYILPEELNIDGEVIPKKLRRGIYEVVVYTSDLNVSGNFKLPENLDQNNLKKIQFDKAFLTIGITDLRGIKNQIRLNWGGQSLGVEPGSRISSLIYSGVTVDLPELKIDSSDVIDFSFALDLQGSRNITFVPLGSTTDVKLKSSWASPKFDGNFLPDVREVNDSGFTAEWKILQLNRNFPQSWVNADHTQKITESAFFVDLIVPLDNYQKSMRSAKYAMMTIGLTFLIFFLVEILNKRKIHPFQYALVGMALCLFYVLLVSITEHANFNQAYGISTIGVVGMITLYSLSVFKAKRLTALLIVTLIGIYGFLFVTLQLSDYALLMGSVGLAIILGATMFFTRKINWYNLNSANESE